MNFTATAKKVKEMLPTLAVLENMTWSPKMLAKVAATLSVDKQGSLAFINSFRYLLNKKVSKEHLTHLLLRYYANKCFIDECMEIPMWGGEPSSTVLKITGLLKKYTERNKQWCQFSALALEGIPAGIKGNTTLSVNFTEYTIAKELHLSFKNFNCYAEELAGMFLRCQIENKNGELLLSNISATPTMVKMNKELQEARNNEFKKCKGTCYLCKHTVSECKLAVRR